jgi:hypothetical protein
MLLAPVGKPKFVGDEAMANGLKLWTNPWALPGAGSGRDDVPSTGLPPTT